MLSAPWGGAGAPTLLCGLPGVMGFVYTIVALLLLFIGIAPGISCGARRARQLHPWNAGSSLLTRSSLWRASWKDDEIDDSHRM